MKVIGIVVVGLACGAVAGLILRAGTPAGSVVPAPIAIGAPSKLIIPSIGVNAPVVPVGVNAKGNLGVPSDAVHVAWYKYGPRPGTPGAAVIDGHLDTWNTKEAVFYNLDKLAPGDNIDVKTATGQTFIFKVTAIKTYPYNATDASVQELFTTKSAVPELNLITCAGDWMKNQKEYTERLAVFSQLYSYK